jgi:uncharacterized protein (TIGR02598 family)
MNAAPSTHATNARGLAQSGFSLVEVVLAVGVVAFAFVGILGLLPAGMHQFRGAIDDTVCSEIAHQVIADAQQTDFDTLIDKDNVPGENDGNSYFTFRAPKVSQPEFRYFDERGDEVVPLSPAARANPDSLSSDEKAKVVYHVLVRVMPQTSVPATLVGIAGGKELATVTVQVARNPSNRPIKISPAGASDGSDPGRQLFAKTPGVSVLTFAAQIARNK